MLQSWSIRQCSSLILTYQCLLVNLASALILKNEVNSPVSWTVFLRGKEGLCRTCCSNKKERNYIPTLTWLYSIQKIKGSLSNISCFMKTDKYPNTYVTLGNLRNHAEVKLDLVLKELCLKRDLRAGELGEENWDIQDWKENCSRSQTGTALIHFTLLFFTCV